MADFGQAILPPYAPYTALGLYIRDVGCAVVEMASAEAVQGEEGH